MYEYILSDSIPMGFGMALVRNEAAMKKYAELSEEEKVQVLENVHSVSSKKEMRSFVDKLAKGEIM